MPIIIFFITILFGIVKLEKLLMHKNPEVTLMEEKIENGSKYSLG